jgi:uncharacterized SAM-binding protein YcdF (DUF218 family)
MFFVVSKIFGILILPFNWFIISLVLFLLLKNEKWKKRFKIVAISIVFVFSNTFLFLEVARIWEYHSPPLNKVKKYDIGIVLGGMAEYNNDTKTLSIRRGGDRIWQALSLYKKGKIKKILISGDSGYVFDRGLSEAKQMKEILVEWGIPSQDIITEELSRNTHENAVETQKMLTHSYPHIEKCLLITSGIHMKRAKACFDKVGLVCDTYSTDLYTGPKRSYYWDQYFIPNVSTLYDWNSLLKEIVGFIIYKMVGYA